MLSCPHLLLHLLASSLLPGVWLWPWGLLLPLRPAGGWVRWGGGGGGWGGLFGPMYLPLPDAHTAQV
jgi:hypothetical protein